MQVSDEMLRAAREAYLEASDLTADAEPMRAALEAALSAAPAEAGARDGFGAADVAFLARDKHATWTDPEDRDAAVLWHWRGFQDGAEWQKARTVPDTERSEK